MKPYFAGYLAIHNIRSARKDRGYNLFGAILAIALSLVPLVVVLVVANGMIEGITRRFIEVGTYHMQVHIYDPLSDEQERDILESLGEVEDLNLAFVERQGLGIITSQQRKIGVQIRSVPSDIYERDPMLRRYFDMLFGNFDLSDNDSVLLGSHIANELNVTVDAEVKLLTGRQLRDGRILPKITRLKVKGIFSTGYQDLDKTWIYIPLNTGKRILPTDSSDQFIGIKTTDPFSDQDAIIQSVRQVFSDNGGLYRLNTWYELEENQYRSFQTTKSLLIFIMLLIVLVAAVNVSTTLVMMVLEKVQDIAILKSMGAHPSTISFSFIITGFFIGIAGTSLGMALGLLLAVNINSVIRFIEIGVNAIRWALGKIAYPISGNLFVQPITLMDPQFYLETIPIRIELWEIMIIGVFTVLLATLAAYFPARRAGRLRPIDVLRKV